MSNIDLKKEISEYLKTSESAKEYLGESDHVPEYSSIIEVLLLDYLRGSQTPAMKSLVFHIFTELGANRFVDAYEFANQGYDDEEDRILLIMFWLDCGLPSEEWHNPPTCCPVCDDYDYTQFKHIKCNDPLLASRIFVKCPDCIDNQN